MNRHVRDKTFAAHTLHTPIQGQSQRELHNNYEDDVETLVKLGPSRVFKVKGPRVVISGSIVTTEPGCVLNGSVVGRILYLFRMLFENWNMI